jgi:hypothetical protein
VIDDDPNSTTYSSEITAIVINQSARAEVLPSALTEACFYTADFGHGPSFAGLYVSAIDTRTNTALLTPARRYHRIGGLGGSRISGQP